MLKFFVATFLIASVVAFNEDVLRDRMETHVRRARAINQVSQLGAKAAANNFLNQLGTKTQIGGLTATGTNAAWSGDCLYGNNPITNPITWGPILPTNWPIQWPNLNNNFINKGKRAAEKLANRDYIFVLDTSGSISNAAFDQAKEGLSVLASSFCPVPTGPKVTTAGSKQVAVVLFSDIVETSIGFGQSTKGIEHVRQQIIKLNHRRGGATATADALKHVRENVLGKGSSRTGNPQVSTDVIVITDGRCNRNCQNLAKEADALRKAGANLFALGIDNIRECELEIITGKGADAATGFNDFRQFTKFTEAVREFADNSPNKCA